MDRKAAQNLIENTFNYSFSEERLRNFTINFLNDLNEGKAFNYISGQYIKDSFKNHIRKYRRLGTYTDPSGDKIDVLIVHLKNPWALERSRTMLRNFVADYLKNRDEKEAALIGYHTDNPDDWRFSFVKMEYRLEESETGKIKVREELTPAKRYSYLVGKNEPNHTAQAQLIDILQNDKKNPTLTDIEKSFSVDNVTKQFYKDYRGLFENLTKELDVILEKNAKIKTEFKNKSIDTTNFSKKLLGQIVFLYFVQKKGWLGVERDEKGNYKEWGTGPKDFMQKLFNKQYCDYKNFFNDILEPLFYSALNNGDRRSDYYDRLNCKIPFLNGGLFEPMNDYDWVETEILIDNDIFTEILETFNRYNFTVREDDPLDKEVAVDPEMLGKVFENLLPENLRKGKGTYYTPRTIVHYMCQESLINYLSTECEDLVKKEDIELLIRKGEIAKEYEELRLEKTAEREDYNGSYKEAKIPDSIKENAKLIDEKLEIIKVCDPAAGSGAFLVGMMNEILKARNVLTTYLSESVTLSPSNGDVNNVILRQAQHDRTIYNLKRHCIQESLHGVDIDPGAIEIAKLRLWLSLVVDEEDYHTIQPLPNLDFKIMQGNSLIEEFHGISLELKKKENNGSLFKDTDNELDKLITELHNKQYALFNAIHDSDKRRLKEEVEEAILNIFHYEMKRQKSDYFKELDKIKIDSQQLKGETFTTYVKEEKAKVYKKYGGFDFEQIEEELREMTRGNKIRNFFPWKLYFADVFRKKGGFDVVIANPPYGFRNVLTKDEKKYFRKERDFSFPSGDIAELFIFFSDSQLVKYNGILTFIIPKKSLYGESWRNVRKFWCSKDLRFLMDASKAFENVLLEQASFSVLKKDVLNNLITIGALNHSSNSIDIFGKFSLNNIFTKDLKNAQIYKGMYPKSLLRKIEERSVDDTSLFLKGEIGISNITKHLTFDSHNNYPCIKGIDVVRYGLKSKRRYLNGKIAMNYIKSYRKKKIVAQKIIAHVQNPKPHIIITIFYDNLECLIHDTCVEIKTLVRDFDKKFIVAYLQSKFVNWFAYNFIYNRAIRTMDFINYYIIQIPLPKEIIEKPNKQKPFISIVDKIISIRKSNPQDEIDSLESEIDCMIYELYGLTEEEIRIVEGLDKD